MNSVVAEPLALVEPGFAPPLQPGFRPAALANRRFREAVAGIGTPLVIGLQRDGGQVTRFETEVFPEGHPSASANAVYVERLVKFLLWQRGGYRVFIGGPRSVAEHIQRCYSPSGERKFDARFMEQVYEQPFGVVSCAPSDVPAAVESGKALGRHLDGCRIGFDLGGSDRKVSAVQEGKVVYSEEVVWEPRRHSDPEYHYSQILSALKTAASKLPRVDAIGGSSAGVFIDNRPMIASLFRGVPADRFGEVRGLFLRLRDELQVPLEVVNDGDVAALAGSMSLEENGVLGIALGTSQGAGWVDSEGRVTGWLNELAFAPVDYGLDAPEDEWSGDIGCGSQYFSQQCVFRLARKAAIPIPDAPDAERLRSVQDKLEAGHEGAIAIWKSMGIFLGYALVHYADFYDLEHVLILGRCTSGLGGSLILDGANVVLQAEAPELAARIQVHLPDERIRRVGQSIAAASLPARAAVGGPSRGGRSGRADSRREP
jgi:predicted NBD/HSP70 family sugar kinase